METENRNRKGSSKMAFAIDLNEAPVSSPREVVEDSSLGIQRVSVCPVCRKGISVGKVHGKVEENKCFRCLLKNDGGGGGEVGRFDINAAPPCEPEEDDCVEVVSVRDGNGGGKIRSSIPLFSSHRIAVSQLNPGLEGIGHNHRKISSVARETFNSGFRVMMLQQKLHSEGLHPIFKESSVDASVQSRRSTLLEYPPESPNMLYLQTLREYIAERAGVLGEGWHVEFEFCDKRYRTSAVYIAPDGSRLKSMEDVAHHIGLLPRYHYIDTEKGNNDFTFTQSALRPNPAKKETSTFLTAQSSRQRHMMFRAGNNHGFLATSGIAGYSEIYSNKNTKEHGISDHSSHRDGIYDGFPIQFQDFCLISPGKIDPRPSYHNTSQIWPVGYRCCWHDRITGSLFVCDVADGGDCGPIFKVQRYSCTMQCMPVGSTILSLAKPGSCKGDEKMGKDDLVSFQVVDDDSISTITLLNEDSPPSLDTCLYTSNGRDDIHSSQENSDMENLHQRFGKSQVDGLELYDFIGEFQIEDRSIFSVWEMVSQALLHAYRETYKQKGVVKFFCDHNVCGSNDGSVDNVDSLSRFYFDGCNNFPLVVQNENELKIVCEKLLEWLNQDRFGLDVDFVQEIIERLPGVATCSEYKDLNNRRQNSGLQTVGSGFLQADRKANSTYGTSKGCRLKLADTEDPLKRVLCPRGKPFNSKLPSYLMGDALQVWELAWRFADVLGLGQSFSFQELELELASPWLDNYPLDNEDTSRTGERKFQNEAASLGKCTGILSAKIIGSLLRLLVCELLSKAAAYVCPNFDIGESKSRRGRKKDLEYLAALKKTKLDMLPVNELTWHEIGRRYILSVLSMEGNLDSTEIATRESGKVFHCLRGDGGILCGSLMGIAALEGDAVILADATKQVFGSLKNKNEIVSLCESESDANVAQTIKVNDGAIPEWVVALEPVRKLPTNVGARIRKCVNDALDKNPPEWAKSILEHSISKEVYKGNASGPTKRAVVAVLTNLSGDNSQQKAEKKEKVKIKTNRADLITKQCRIVLRKAVASDEDKVFCNLLARVMLNSNDNDEEGLLGYPAMVSRPLDFRTIDLRLATGAYGSHEAFVDDVREVWRNIRIAYGDRSDLVDVAEDLSKTFEGLYEKEVLALVEKISEISDANDSSPDAIKERDDLLVHVCNSSLPRAPWDEGVCKVCGMDKDDDNVLLCDKCDSEYHRYCLNPPLLRIPEGNWYCPSCVSSQYSVPGTVYGTVANQYRKRSQGEFTYKFLEELARLANLMEVKEYWEFTVEERIFFMKFLFDEALNSATMREHMDQCASRVADLQHRLRSLTSELRLLKVKEEMLGFSKEKATSGLLSGRGDLTDASSTFIAIESSSRGKPSERGNHLSASSGSSQLEHVSSLNEQVGYPKQLDLPPSGSNKSTIAADTLDQGQCQHLVGDHDQHENCITPAQQSRGSILKNELPITILFSGSPVVPVTEQVHTTSVTSTHESHGHPSSDQVDMLSSQENSLKIGTIKKDIINLQETIASVELELLKVSLRRDFLGRDSNGRVYWAFHSAGSRPWIIASGDSASKNRSPEEFISIPGFDKWMYYESDDEIEKLVGWLRENNVRERELRDSILQLQSNRLKDSHYRENHMLGKGDMEDNRNKALFAEFFTTKAIAVLEKTYGPCSGTRGNDVCVASGVCEDKKMYRCECLELLWSSKDHCTLCHQNFSSNEDLKQHSKENCKALTSVATKRSLPTEDVSKRKKPRNVALQEKPLASIGNLQISKSEKQNFDRSHNDCPFRFEEIMTRFIAPGTVKDEVNNIGLIYNGGMPSFLSVMSPYIDDPALALDSAKTNESTLRNQRHYPNNDTSALVGMKESNKSKSRYAENGLSEGSSERLKSLFTSECDRISPSKDKGALLGISKSSIVRESSSRPLVGRAYEILKFLKINLLDMDAALPKDALRTSRSNQDKRCKWRSFVKSAKSIYEMVQALIVFEDTIRSDYLRNDWWYWSSPSTAAKITTLSALALRIYTLDSAISYETPLHTTAEVVDPNCLVDDEVTPLANPSSPSPQKAAELDVSDTPRTTRSRANKRRKDLNS